MADANLPKNGGRQFTQKWRTPIYPKNREWKGLSDNLNQNNLKGISKILTSWSNLLMVVRFSAQANVHRCPKNDTCFISNQKGPKNNDDYDFLVLIREILFSLAITKSLQNETQKGSKVTRN